MPAVGLAGEERRGSVVDLGERDENENENERNANQAKLCCFTHRQRRRGAPVRPSARPPEMGWDLAKSGGGG